MSASASTRQAIVQSTKQLSARRSFQRLSVTEIARHCGINRNTFYYYFSDKYQVIRWIFTQELLPVLEARSPHRSLADSVTALCTRMKQEKSFYSRILEEDSRFRELLVDYYKRFLMDLASARFREHGMEDRDQEIAARFYAHGTVGMICDWAACDMRMDSSFAASIIQLAASEKFFV